METIPLPSYKECIDILVKAGCDKGVIEHSKAVTELAVKMGSLCGANIRLIEVGALLHDIGRSRTHTIRHAVEGAEILKELKLPPEVIHIVERHIGAGIPKEDTKKLGLPHKDYIPETLEEKIVAHADNLIGGARREKVESALKKWRIEGLEDGARRIENLHNELCKLCGIDIDEIK
ncbi:MAG: HDIG domain-containing metalloprotein [Thermoplasmata archaeon]